MNGVIKAERLKMKHTFGRCLPVIAPVITMLLVLVLTGGIENAFPAGSWNWWYVALLPGMLAVMCYLNAAKEKKNRYYHLNTLAVSKKKLMFGKMLYLSLGLLLANGILFAGTVAGGAFLGTTISIRGAAAGAGLLTVSYLWEIPFFMFLSMRFGMFADIFWCMVMTAGGTAALADSAFWWTAPFSIPVRLMCPALGLLPNGLAIPAGDALLSGNVILPGILLSLGWFAAAAVLFLRWFEKTEVK